MKIAFAFVSSHLLWSKMAVTFFSLITCKIYPNRQIHQNTMHRDPVHPVWKCVNAKRKSVSMTLFLLIMRIKNVSKSIREKTTSFDSNTMHSY